LSFGGIGAFSVIKLVNPTKVFRSWPANQTAFDHRLLPQTKANVWACCTGILWETDPAVGQELGGFDSLNRVLDQTTEFLSLLVSYGGSQILDFH